MGLRLAIPVFAILLASFPAWAQPESSEEPISAETEMTETLDESFFAGPEVPSMEPEPVRVMIDPGHGGEDLGVRSTKHILEKNITLKIARAIVKRLSRDDRIEAALVRQDDRSMDWLGRLEYANSGRGDLYIGVHTDGGGSPRSNPMRVYIHKSADVGAQEGKTAWNALNNKYGEDNRTLAEAVALKLDAFNGAARGVKMIENGRLLLGGLAMPAVIIEPVDLSNPEDEIRLEDEKYLEDMAAAIAQAIMEYIGQSGLFEKKAAAVELGGQAGTAAPADTTAVFSGGGM